MGSQNDGFIRSLVVDDDSAIGETLKDLISRDDTLVESFEDGHEAIRYIEEEGVDVVITDLMMPEIGGLELLRHAKRINPDVAVIIITGHASLDTAIEAVKEGAYDYIRKPFKLQEVEIAFNNAVERVRLVQKNRELFQELRDAYEQLVAMKKRHNACSDGRKNRPKKTAPLNFFSRNIPSLDLLHSAQAGQNKILHELERLSRLRKDGSLTDREFDALKSRMIKAIETYE